MDKGSIPLTGSILQQTRRLFTPTKSLG